MTTSLNDDDMDDIKAIWRKLDRLETRQRVDDVRDALRGHRWLPIRELLVHVVEVVLVGAFIGAHVSEPRFVAAAAVLQIAAVIMLAATVWELAALKRINFSMPVMSMQRTLAGIREMRLRINRGILLGGALLWTPMLIVLLRLVGVDAYAALGARYLLANVAFGLAVVAIGLWWIRRYRPRLRASGAWKRVADDLSGRSLARAVQFVDDLSAFEKNGA